MTLIHELDLEDQLYKLSKDIDIIIHNKISSISIYSLFNKLFEKSKG